MHMLNWSHNDPSWLCNSLPSWMGVLGLHHAIMPSWDQEVAMTLIPIPRTLDIYGHGKLKPRWPMFTMAFILSLPSCVSCGFYMLWWDQGAMGLNPILIPQNLDIYVHEIEVTMADGGYVIHCVICLSHGALTCMMRSRGHGFKSNSNSMKLRYISMGYESQATQWPWLFCSMYLVLFIGICHASTCHKEGAWGFVMFDGWVDLGRFYPLYTKVGENILWLQMDFFRLQEN
jgi:hypothetical protein